MWLWVSLNYATYGIKVEKDVIVEAAPIAHWMIGKNVNYIYRWVAKRGGVVVQTSSRL